MRRTPRPGLLDLLAAVAELYPIEFRRMSQSTYSGLDALLILDSDLARALAAAVEGLPCLVIGLSGGTRGQEKIIANATKFRYKGIGSA